MDALILSREVVENSFKASQTRSFDRPGELNRTHTKQGSQLKPLLQGKGEL